MPVILSDDEAKALHQFMTRSADAILVSHHGRAHDRKLWGPEQDDMRRLYRRVSPIGIVAETEQLLKRGGDALHEGEKLAAKAMVEAYRAKFGDKTPEEIKPDGPPLPPPTRAEVITAFERETGRVFGESMGRTGLSGGLD